MTSLNEIEPKPTKFMHPLAILNLDLLPILLSIYIYKYRVVILQCSKEELINLLGNEVREKASRRDREMPP